MKTSLRTFCLGLGLLGSTVAYAQSVYPNQPIRWIVPYAAGGGTDVIARNLAEAMQPGIAQPLVIDNRPGASTNIGVAQLLQAKPNGYTVMQAENAALLFNEHLFAKLPYKPDADFTYIGAIGRLPVALVVGPNYPARTLAEFITHAKAQGDKLSYASPGNGSPHHLAMELFKQASGLNAMAHVPYKGAAPAMQDVVGGQVPVMMLDLASGLQMIKSGKMRALAVALPKRAQALPDVPTFDELGHKEVNAFAYQGLIGPAGMPQDVVDRLNSELNKALHNAKVQKLFAEFGLEVLPGTSKDFYSTARSESARWGKVIKAASIQLD